MVGPQHLQREGMNTAPDPSGGNVRLALSILKVTRRWFLWRLQQGFDYTWGQRKVMDVFSPLMMRNRVTDPLPGEAEGVARVAEGLLAWACAPFLFVRLWS